MTTVLHPLARDWLARLDAVADSLPPEEAAELHADLVDHLTQALPADADLSTAQAVLRDLGAPEDAVEAARGGVQVAGAVAVPSPHPRLRGLDVLVLVALVVFGLVLGVPFVGMLIWLGVLALVLNSGWSRADKLIAAIPLLPAGAAMVLHGMVVLVPPDGTGFGLNAQESFMFIALLGVAVVLPVSLATVGVLLWRLLHRQ